MKTALSRLFCLAALINAMGFASPTFGKDKPVLKVGVSSALSGALAEYGVALQNGIQLALSEKPATFRKVTFLFEDDRYDPQAAISAFRKFLTIDGVNVLFALGAAPTEALIPLAERHKLPLFALVVNPDSFRGKQYAIRFINSSRQYTDITLHHFRKLKAKRFGLVMTDSSYFEDMSRNLNDGLIDGETLVIAAKVSPSESDFKTVIAKLKQARYDAVGVYLFPGQVSAFYRQAKALGFYTPTFGSEVFESSREISDSNGTMEGAVYAFNLVDQDFARRYRARFGNDAQLAVAAKGFDFATMIAASAVQFDNSPTGLEILESMKHLSPRNGASGQFTFRADLTGGQFFDFPIVMKQINNGEILVLKD